MQHRRARPARATQQVQIAIQNELLEPALARDAASTHPPLAVTALQRWPWLRRLPARLVGIGLRPKRVTESAHPPLP